MKRLGWGFRSASLGNFDERHPLPDLGREIIAYASDVAEIGGGCRSSDHVIVEVQRGTYTGEDDVCRLEDN